jgi:hypothetical protein
MLELLLSEEAITGTIVQNKFAEAEKEGEKAPMTLVAW